MFLPTPPFPQIPLAPPEVLTIWNAVRPYEFVDSFGAWPNRRLVGGAKETIFEGVKKILAAEGFKPEDFVIEL